MRINKINNRKLRSMIEKKSANGKIYIVGCLSHFVKYESYFVKSPNKIHVITPTQSDTESFGFENVYRLSTAEHLSSDMDFLVLVFSSRNYAAIFPNDEFYEFLVPQRAAAKNESFGILIEKLYNLGKGNDADYIEAERIMKFLKFCIEDKDYDGAGSVEQLLLKKQQSDRFGYFFAHMHELLAGRQYDAAQRSIENFMNPNALPVRFVDDISLYIELKKDILTRLTLNYETMLADAEKKIFKFKAAYGTLLAGEITKMYRVQIEIMRLKVFENPELQPELDKLLLEYEAHISTIKNSETAYFLSDEQKKEIRRLYKLAVKYCHPDTVKNEHREAANDVFIKLKSAYDRNDIDAVKTIYEFVRHGTFHVGKTAEAPAEFLRAIVAWSNLKKKFNETVQSSIYQQIKDMEDYDEYFRDKLTMISMQMRFLTEEFDTLVEQSKSKNKDK